MNYLKQVYYEMRHQKMMTWVSIGGTALAIFLVMAFIMADRINTVEVPPVSNRMRIMEGSGIHIENKDGTSSYSTSGLNYNFANRLYRDLDGVDMISYGMISYGAGGGMSNVNVKGKEIKRMMPRLTDAKFWKFHDFTFIDGRPYDDSEVAADAKLVVLTKTTARTLFGEDKVSGREIMIDSHPYRVIGVVDDVNPLLSTVYAQVYEVFNPENARPSEYYPDYQGNIKVLLLLRKGVGYAHIKSQVAERYDRAKSEFESKEKGMTIIYHDQPYSPEEVALGLWNNVSPDLSNKKRGDLILFTIIMLIPAINLSSMTRGRLRHRVSEIGVRRAFGARRSSIILQFLGENFIITLIGGAIGLVICFLFMILLSNVFFNFSGNFFGVTSEEASATPDLNMLFTWSNFLLALLFCFILNVLSASIPAWRASRVEPAAAISAVR